MRAVLHYLIFFLFSLSWALGDAAASAFVIKVVDGETNRGVPLVGLTATSGQRWFTDSHGIAAIDNATLMGKKVFFSVRSHGYTFPKDGFGSVGKRFDIIAGKQVTLKVKRTQIAQRLYRITGAGIYAPSLKAGREAPIKKPLLNAGVTGCDSVLSIVYQKRIHWFWGDTNRLEYPLGNFHTTGATSALPGSDGYLDPELGVNLNYFGDGKGFVKPMAKLPGDGPTWLSGLAVLPDKNGRQRMVASYVKIRKFLEVYERGLVVWNDEKAEFELVAKLPLDAPSVPQGHTFLHKPADRDGQKMIYFGDPYPFLRIPYSFEAWSDSSTYEVFTLLEEKKYQYGWKKDKSAKPWSIEEQKKKMTRKPAAKWIQLEDAAGRGEVIAHRGTVNWNAFRKKWIMITTQVGGKASYLGEVWYAEADNPEGPWKKAVKIVTHDHYSFYNPRHHPFFDDENGRLIYFEGTYTAQFSRTKHKTPLYDYNQIMYRLDLDDKRLRAAHP